ncbi:MAG TPA: hypothetical protein PKA54_07585 [Chitinophagaceae bacterium]|nr:MAG: hypothetical protein UZ11_BCD004001383 [Bacteroidetes bacterium OLB11]HMN33219.1 hypothetical protein [Chitinophagaceae bacterium]
MLKQLFILLFCLIGYHSFSQNLFISDSEDLNLRTDDFSVVGVYNNRVVCFVQKGNEVTLLFYSSFMQKENELKLSILPNRFSNLQFFTNNQNELIVLYEVNESKSNKLYASKLIDGVEPRWDQPSLISKMPIGSGKGGFSYTVNVSENKETFFAYTLFNNDGGLQLQSVVFDIHLNIKQNISQTLSPSEMNYPAKSAVTDDGTCFIIMADKLGNRDVFENIKLFESNPYSTAFLAYTITNESRAFSDLQMNIDNQNQLLHINSFFYQNRNSSLNGIFLSTFDMKNHTFPKKYFSRIAVQNSVNHSNLKDLNIRKVLIKENGAVTIIAEKYYQSTRVLNTINPMMGTSFMMANDNSRRVTEFNYNEIDLFHFKIDGSLLWSQTVLKEQFTSEDGGIFSSFYVFEHPLGQAILFNDLSNRTPRLLVAYIGTDGKLTMKQIQTNEQIDEWNLMPRSAIQISKSALIMPCIMKNHLSFLKINF